MNGKMMTLTFFELYTVYIKRLGQLFFHTYSLTCLNKDTSILLKFINLWTNSKVKYKNNGRFLKICAQSL